MCRAETRAGTAKRAHPARVSDRQLQGRTFPTCESSSSSSSKVKARNLELCQYSSSSARTLLICNGTARLTQHREGGMEELPRGYRHPCPRSRPHRPLPLSHLAAPPAPAALTAGQGGVGQPRAEHAGTCSSPAGCGAAAPRSRTTSPGVPRRPL